MTNDPVLSIRPLPTRPTRLSPDDLRDVFGGCDDEGEYCSKDSDCCGDMTCSDAPPRGMGPTACE